MRWLAVVVPMLALVACGEEEAPPPPAMGPIASSPSPEPVQPVPVEPKPEPAPAPTTTEEPPAGEPARPPSPASPPSAGSRSAPDAPAPTAATEEPCPAGEPADGTFAADVTWSNVRPTEGCFFFSGPGRLGRDQRYGDAARVQLSDGRATVTFDGARFTGAAGDRVALSRVTTHEHSGQWRVTERIVGEWVPGTARYEHTSCADRGSRTIRGRYRYQECEVANAASCPGRCQIQADVTLRLR